jgi:hypothetical protein
MSEEGVTKPATGPQTFGRWTLQAMAKGAARLVYRPRLGTTVAEFDIDSAQLRALRALAAEGKAAEVRDLLLNEQRLIRIRSSPPLSGLVAANTWRWALPLLGGPAPLRGGRRAQLHLVPD